MFPVINIGPLAIQSFGLIILIGVWLGLSWSERNAAKFEIKSDLIFTLFFPDSSSNFNWCTNRICVNPF